mgnify:CR=1 FL=1
MKKISHIRESMHPQIKPEGAPSNVAFPLSLTFLTAARLPNLASQAVIQQLLPNLAGLDSAARRRLLAQVVLLSTLTSLFDARVADCCHCAVWQALWPVRSAPVSVDRRHAA